jgi:hypothetical protein
MNKIQPALITFIPALGSTASPYAGMVKIDQRLCFNCCADSTPVFAPQFSVKSIAPAGTNLYVATIHAEGIISYVPCNGGCCCTKTQPLSGDVEVLISSETVPTVTIAPGASINALAVTACQPCSRTFTSATPLTITVA